MAERRMIAIKLIDSDTFLDMPSSAQALYFHLAMRADDDGFLGNPKRIRKDTCSNQIWYVFKIIKILHKEVTWFHI